MAGLIDDYVAALRRDLDDDPMLADRMAEEVESHLWEAAEADPAWPASEAQRRAVERFGLARDIARQCAADAMNRQTKRTWIALLATVAVTFIAMRLRIVWLGEGSDTLSTLAPLVDRYAFIAALVVAGIGWFAFRRSLLPLAICSAALAASIAAGIVRAGLFVDGAPVHVLLTAAGEIALIGLLSLHIVRLGRRSWRAALLGRSL